MQTTQKNYTLGRGKVYFARFKPGTYTPAGYLYIGNTPEFNLTIESEDLDHFSSDEGIREKDDGVTLEVTRTGSLITDNISPENVALFFFGEVQKLTQAASGPITETLTEVVTGLSYPLGVTDLNPNGVAGIDAATFSVKEAGGSKASGTITFAGVPTADDTVTIGARVYTFKAAVSAADEVLIGASGAASASNLSAAINAGAGSGTAYGSGTVAHADVDASVSGSVVTVTAKASGTAGNAIALLKSGTNITVSGATLTGGTAGGATYVVDVDYKLDPDVGLLELLNTGSIVDGSDIEVEYSLKAATRDRVISGTNAVEGAMMYVAKNPKGKNIDYRMLHVQVRPNGDYALKGDEWQQIPMTLQILKPRSSAAAITADGRPVYA